MICCALRSFQRLEISERLTLEAFVSDIAIWTFDVLEMQTSTVTWITVKAEKPSGLIPGKSTGVEICRPKTWFKSLKRS